MSRFWEDADFHMSENDAINGATIFGCPTSHRVVMQRS